MRLESASHRTDTSCSYEAMLDRIPLFESFPAFLFFLLLQLPVLSCLSVPAHSEI